MLLAACETVANSKTVYVVKCPALAEYDMAMRNRVADELIYLGDKAATRRMIADYITLRDRCRALRG